MSDPVIIEDPGGWIAPATAPDGGICIRRKLEMKDLESGDDHLIAEAKLTLLTVIEASGATKTFSAPSVVKIVNGGRFNTKVLADTSGVIVRPPAWLKHSVKGSDHGYTHLELGGMTALSVDGQTVSVGSFVGIQMIFDIE